MPNIDWKFLIIGALLALYGLPLVLSLLGRRTKATATA